MVGLDVFDGGGEGEGEGDCFRRLGFEGAWARGRTHPADSKESKEACFTLLLSLDDFPVFFFRDTGRATPRPLPDVSKANVERDNLAESSVIAPSASMRDVSDRLSSKV